MVKENIKLCWEVTLDATIKLSPPNEFTPSTDRNIHQIFKIVVC